MSEATEARPSVPRGFTALVVLFGVVIVFAVGVFVGKQQGARAAVPTGEGHVLNQDAQISASLAKDVNFAQFWEVWNILKDRFYKQPLSDKSLYYGAVKGLVAGAGDPYTMFFDPEEATQFTDDLGGAFQGIGAEIGIKDMQLQIIAPLAESPAAKAGLRTGDFILQIDGKSTDGLDVGAAVKLIRGEAGTQVTLTLLRGKEKSFDVKITRAKITVDSVKWEIKDGIATISVSIFGPDTSALFTKAVNEVLAKGAKGILLDLRGNPGGLLNAAVDLATVWVGQRPVVLEKGPGIDRTYSGVVPARLNDLPTVILVDGGSASASEILAGALQDYGLATLVGTQTFGKGSVQDLIDLTDGSAVKVTIAAWHTPKDRSIHEIGITPDVVVPLSEQDIHDRNDLQKTKALEILRGKLAGTR